MFHFGLKKIQYIEIEIYHAGGLNGQGFGWYVDTNAMDMCIYLYVPSFMYTRSSPRLTLNTWQYLGITYDYQTGKLFFIFSKGYPVHISLVDNSGNIRKTVKAT